ncbi:MAG: hypothetical protein QOF37_1799 [Thermoleophilaceae bacterium]|jgi:hypothetical protein|nr:hypothetical protein [Thermoleophilaceae bacterium]
MTRDEAKAHARELGDADPEHSFFVRERDGEWEVVMVASLHGRTRRMGTATEARPRPEADDPRTSLDRLIPPFGPGL